AWKTRVTTDLPFNTSCDNYSSYDIYSSNYFAWRNENFIIDATKVFAITNRRIVAINLSDGTEAWRYPLAYSSTIQPSPPATAQNDNSIFITIDKKIYALNKTNGSVTWNTDVTSTSLSRSHTGTSY